MKRICLLVFAACMLYAPVVQPQQLTDNNFDLTVPYPAYPVGKGPVIFVDEAHNNFHTVEGRYAPFARVLKKDGFILKASHSKITLDWLKQCDLFVISDPMLIKGESPFTPDEAEALYQWVNEGGSVCLITDHYPDPPALSVIAERFGVTLLNGWVLNTARGEEVGPIYFRKTDQTLKEHPITRGRSGMNEEIPYVVSFTGCAFQAEDPFIPLMVLGKDKTSYPVENPDRVNRRSPQQDVEGWYQGGVMEVGQGRLAFFSEAGMFTAQTVGPQRRPFGINAPIAPHNAQFLLNVFRWLGRRT